MATFLAQPKAFPRMDPLWLAGAIQTPEAQHLFGTDTNGMRNLKEVLINEYGLDMTGWTLLQLGMFQIAAR